MTLYFFALKKNPFPTVIFWIFLVEKSFLHVDLRPEAYAGHFPLNWESTNQNNHIIIVNSMLAIASMLLNRTLMNRMRVRLCLSV